MIAVAGMGVSTSYHFLLFWLIWEGVGFGGFLASAQAYIAENTVIATRGSAMGFYSMTGGIGNTLAPVLLGAIGAAWGLASVFVVSGVLLAMGMCAMCWIWWRRPGPSYGLG
jgi:MFS family permease